MGPRSSILSYGTGRRVLLACLLAALFNYSAAGQNSSTKKPVTKLLPSAPAPWAPPDVDAGVPGVTPGVACPLPEVLAATSTRVKELVDNLQRFTATETIENNRLAKNGKWSRPETRSYRYLAFISEIRPGFLSANEHRRSKGSDGKPATPLISDGLGAFALIFHPYYLGDFDMVCEGMSEYQGHSAWQVHFAQRSDKVPRFHDFRVGDRPFNVKQKGRAWINAETFQVERLDIDLMEPVPLIRLKTEHMSIEYQPVQFVKRNIKLWLPDHAELFVDYRGQRYRFKHAFNEYLLFSVETSQDIEGQQP